MPARLPKPWRLQTALIVLLASACGVVSGRGGSPDSWTSESWFPPQEQVVITSRRDAKAGEKVLEASLASAPAEKREIYRYSRSASVVVSPDQSFLAMNHAYCSTDSTILLFRRGKGISYALIKGVNLPEAAGALLMEKLKLSTGDLDHFYVEALQWSRDDARLLCRAFGHGDGIGLHQFFFVYDLATGRAGLDLTSMDKAAVEKGSSSR